MKNDSAVMTEGSYKKKIVYFAIPIFFGSLFQQMYSTADSLIVGNFLGSSALAAVSSSGNLIFLLIGFIQGLTIGCSVVIARFIGARDHKMTSLAVHTTVALGLVSSLVLTLVGIFLAPQILRLMSTPEEIMDQSVEFFRMYFLGSAGFVMYNTLVSILQASGDSKHPVYYLIIASIINILLDLLFIGVFRFGVGAAGVATSISQTISALLALHQLMTQSGPCRVDLRKIRFQPQILKMIIKFGLPSGLQNSIIGLSNVIIQSYINFYGKNAVAGIGSYCKVEGFAFLPVTCFTMALTTFVAQNLGAKEYRKNQSRSSIRHDLHAGFGGRVGDFAVRVLASADWSVRQHACSGQFRRCKSTRLRSVLFPRGLYARDGCRHARSREGNDSDDNHDDLLVCRQNSDFVRCRDVLSNDSNDLLGLSVDVDAQFVGISAMLPRT